MNIKRAKQEIKDTIEAYLHQDEFGNYQIPSIRQRPILLIGPPGVGKTQIMEQIAKECGIGLVSYTITHHTRQSAIGLPFIEKRQYGGKEYTVTEYTMSEIVASVYHKMESTGLKKGILFLDEINCVSETLAPAMLQFLQCKTFGSHKIPEGWLIAAAGNPPEYNKSVRDFDVVTLDRIKKIDIEPDFEIWKEYAYQESIHPAVISYLQIKKQYFCLVETTVDGKQFATPRGWEDLSRLMEVYHALGKKTDREVIVQYLQHPKIAKDFANYLELYDKYQKDYQVEEILSGVIKESLCDKVSHAPFDEKLSLVGLLLSRLSQEFRELLFQEEVMERLMGELRKVQGNMDVLSSLNQVISHIEEKEEQLRKQEILTKTEDLLGKQMLSMLEAYQHNLYEMENLSNQQSLRWLKEAFSADSDRFEDETKKAASMLEHGFDFMEAAFGDSQEMVLWITELNTNPFCVTFLQKYDCPRYYEYNRRLLFDDQEKEILSGI